jgi:hypothetical protein
MGHDRMLKLEALLEQLEKRICLLDLSDLTEAAVQAGVAAPAKQRGRPRKVAAT